MGIVLNVPPTTTPAGAPLCIYEYLQVSQITADGTNVFPIYMTGMQVVTIDNRGGAALMLQIIPQGSIAGQPYVRFLDANTERTFSFKVPLASIILSNMSFPVIPLFFDKIFTTLSPANKNVTSGFVLISATDAELDFAASDIPLPFPATLGSTLNQAALFSGTAPASATTVYSVPISNDINGLLILLANSANVTTLSVTGHQTGNPYFSQPGPYAAQVAVPVASAYDTSVDVAITMPVGQTCAFYVSGRRDSLLTAITQLDQPPVSITSPAGGMPVKPVGVSLPVGTNQVQLDQRTAPAGVLTTYQIGITPDLNGVVLGLSNSANITSLVITGTQTSLPLFSQGSPYAALVACPILSATDTQITIAITMPAAQTCVVTTEGRRDSLLQAVTALNQPPASQTVNGIVGVSGQVTVKPVGNTLPVDTSQVALDQRTAAAAFTTTYQVAVTKDVNGIVLGLSNSANVTTLVVTGTQTGLPLFSQAGPYVALVAIPVTSAYDTQVTIAVTMPAAQTCVVSTMARRDSLLSAVTNLDQPPLSTSIPGGVGISGTVGVINGGGTDLSTTHKQVSLSSGTLPVNTVTAITVPITTDYTCLFVYVDQSLGVCTGFTAQGVQSGMWFRGDGSTTPGPAPSSGSQASLNVVPLINAYDTSVKLTFTTSALAAVKYWIIARRDAFHTSIDQFDTNSTITVRTGAGSILSNPTTDSMGLVRQHGLGVALAPQRNMTSGDSDGLNTLPVLQNASAGVGGGGVANTSGYNGILNVELVNTNTGTPTVQLQGSFDNVNFYNVGYYALVLLGVGQAALTRSAANIATAGAYRNVYQLLDPYPYVRANISAAVGVFALTAKLYAVPA